jgi:hypothetical protein
MSEQLQIDLRDNRTGQATRIKLMLVDSHIQLQAWKFGEWWDDTPHIQTFLHDDRNK